ncbi:MAG: MATE family efflux transporter [Eubacteriaceae bacterium]|jgi:putative MATE family efflux protein
MSTVQQNNLFREYLRYTLHSVTGMVGLSCYVLADTLFIARGVGADGLAALNIALPVYSLVFGVGMMIATGSAIRFSMLQAKGETERADAVFSEAIALSLTLSLIFSCCGFFFADRISAALGASGQVLELTSVYIRTITLFSPMFMMNSLFMCFVRNDQAPRLAMRAQLIGTLFNIIFDYILVFPMGMGMFGAALATCFSPVVSMLIMLEHKLRGNNHFHLTFWKEKTGFDWKQWNPKSLLTTCRLGLPSLVYEISSGIVIIVFNYILLGLAGDTGVAAYGIIANLAIVIVSVFNGIGQGIQPIVSTACARGENEAAHTIYRWAVWTAVSFAAVIIALSIPNSSFVAGLFSQDADSALISLAVPGIDIYVWSFLFTGFNIVTVNYLAARTLAGKSFTVSILRGLALVIPAVFILSSYLGITGVWLAVPCAELLTCMVAVAITRHTAV